MRREPAVHGHDNPSTTAELLAAERPGNGFDATAAASLRVILAVDADMHGQPADTVTAELMARLQAVGIDASPWRLRSFAEAISDGSLEE
jgi:hypothetical protein